MEENYVTSIGKGIYSINTGDWRVNRPVINYDKCIKCGICFLYCPVFSVEKKDDRYEIDYSFCKGCGICAHECPKHAIEMVTEAGK